MDFVIIESQKPIQAIECKIKPREVSPSLKYFKKKFPQTECIQVHLETKEKYISKEDIKVFPWNTFLQEYTAPV